MRVRIVDPPAFTPPYDRSLSGALARAGAEVRLDTSRFTHGSVPPADGYVVDECFQRRASAREGTGRALKLAEHVADMMRERRREGWADVVHYQWLPVPPVDAFTLAPTRPRVLTAHGILRAEAWHPRPLPGLRRLLGRMDAVVSLFEEGAVRLREEAGLPADRVRVIPHGALDYLTRLPHEEPLPAELAAVDAPVILCFGLVRPYKGVDVLVRAFAQVDSTAELWVVGRPMGVDLEELRALAGPAAARVRFVPRFVADEEVPAYFRRADVVALPHRDADQSGVLFAALAFARPIVMSAVGGLRDVAEAHGAGVAVPPGDADALAAELDRLLADEAARADLAARAAAAAAGPYSWDSIAAQTLALYRELGAG